MSDGYDPRDWYWTVGADPVRTWSSRRVQFVAADDADFVAWRALGWEPPHMGSEEELQSVLRGAGVPASLVDYAAARRYIAEIGGMTFGGSRYATDRETQAKYAGAAMMAQLNPAATFEWKALDGFVTLDAAGMLAVATAAGVHVQDCFALEASLTAAIAEGTVTTAEEIDAADWPGETV